MNKKTASVCGTGPQRESARVSLRAGMAKDKLTLIIVCSAALGVAVLTLAVKQFSGGGFGGLTSRWQCLNPECDKEFSRELTQQPPVECPSCGGQAAKLIHRKCPKCGEENVIYRTRLTEEGLAQYEATKDEQPKEKGPIRIGAGAIMPSEVQFWHKQEDGSYAWSDWMPMNQMYRGQVCSKCGASLYESR